MLPSHWFSCLFPFPLLASSFSVFLSFSFLSFSLFGVFPCLSCFAELLSSANMAHSSAVGRTVPERSRSRDDPMWHSQPTQRGRQHDPRSQALLAPRLRKVLAIVDIQGVRSLMNKTHVDVVEATTCDVTPFLTRIEERSLFTYNVLLNTHRLESFTYQPAHLVHLGPLLTSGIHGHQMAR